MTMNATNRTPAHARGPVYGWSDVFVLSADTGPEASGPLAAPPDCASAEQYRSAVRERYVTNPATRQQLLILARHVAGDAHRRALPVTGPFAEEARAILAAIATQAKRA
jgi:hypothetical protein